MPQPGLPELRYWETRLDQASESTSLWGWCKHASSRSFFVFMFRSSAKEKCGKDMEKKHPAPKLRSIFLDACETLAFSHEATFGTVSIGLKFFVFACFCRLALFVLSLIVLILKPFRGTWCPHSTLSNPGAVESPNLNSWRYRLQGFQTDCCSHNSRVPCTWLAFFGYNWSPYKRILLIQAF